MATYTIGGHEYQSENMDAVTQWNVARRISPLVAELAPIFAMQLRVEDFILALSTDTSWTTDFLRRVSKELAKMSDEDTKYILAHTLSRAMRLERNPNTGEVVSRVPLWNPSANALQYSDVKMPHMVQLVWYVLRENLGDFFNEFLSSSTE